MKKKTVIILSSVVAICGLGVVTSHFLDWPVDSEETGGDIAKSVRFSRQEASEKLTNMEELLQNDPAFKDGIVAAQVVMQTRATQFAALVDMSNEVAGGISVYADVLNDMNKAVEIVTNANNSLAEAGGDLNAALAGEECPDLEQNTINAAMAYTTLQKQNKVADLFIEVTDKYLETAQGDDRLKFVRDQWLEYQQMTAALEGNKENAEALAKKSNLLSGEKTLGALASFGPVCQASIINSCQVAKSFNIDTQIASTLPSELLGQLVSSVRSAAGATMQQLAANGALNQRQVEQIYNKEVGEAIKNAFENASGNRANAMGQHYKDGLNLAQKEVLAHRKIESHNAQKDVLAHRKIESYNATIMNSASKVLEAFNTAMSSVANNSTLQQSQNIGLGQRIGDVINQTALGLRDPVM
jgi:hypothetical protein